MLAFLWSCVILTIKVSIGSLVISAGLLVIGGLIGLLLMLIQTLMGMK